MKLVAYSWKGQRALGALTNGHVVNLHRAHPSPWRRSGDDLLAMLHGGDTSLAAARQALRVAEEQGALGSTSVTLSASEVELLPPVSRPGKLVCVGLNYLSHLAEIGEPVPEYPILFHKPATSIIGHGQVIVLPRTSRQVDYEGELAVVIGRRGKYIPQQDALSYVAGYTCANDVSAHDLEFRTSQWTSGKMLDTFCPLGPAIVTADEIPDPGSLRLRTVLNGRTVQDQSTSDMVFSVPFLISYISSLATLEPGDVVLTGTPAGIGCNQKPQVFLQAGDQISVQIEGIGTLTNPVGAEEDPFTVGRLS
jgi:2-keto-4-pentenoate hydratase/2-oxohepta-3-ene-1,7-dioic acid hydratase in catechol pathway